MENIIFYYFHINFSYFWPIIFWPFIFYSTQKDRGTSSTCSSRMHWNRCVSCRFECRAAGGCRSQRRRRTASARSGSFERLRPTNEPANPRDAAFELSATDSFCSSYLHFYCLSPNLKTPIFIDFYCDTQDFTAFC